MREKGPVNNITHGTINKIHVAVGTAEEYIVLNGIGALGAAVGAQGISEGNARKAICGIVGGVTLTAVAHINVLRNKND